LTWTCPYCQDPGASDRHCARCGRDPSAPRRVCGACRKLTPTKEPRCCHCGSVYTSDLWWKIPVVVALMILAVILRVILR